MGKEARRLSSGLVAGAIIVITATMIYAVSRSRENKIRDFYNSLPKDQAAILRQYDLRNDGDLRMTELTELLRKYQLTKKNENRREIPNEADIL